MSGKQSLQGGMGSPEPPSLAQPCPGQPTLGSGPSALAVWAVWPQPRPTVWLCPGFSHSWGSDPQSHQCP